MKARIVALRSLGGIGALIGYGCLAAFLYLIGRQIYSWFRLGEWMPIGVSDGMRMGLLRCCFKDGDTGRLAAFLQWLDSRSVGGACTGYSKLCLRPWRCSP